MTSARTSGISTTCSASAAACTPPARSPPQPRHAPGSSTTFASGVRENARPLPGCPCCPPRFFFPGAGPPAGSALRRSRSSRRRSARVPGPSLDGGFEEFCESRPVLAINSDTSWSRASIFASCASARAWSAAITASFAASRTRPSLINAA